MPVNEGTIRALRSALAQNPENLDLRKHLGELLLMLGRYPEAEQEFREALTRAPEDPDIKVSLAEVFFQEDKFSEALVIIEALLTQPAPPPGAHRLAAHLYLHSGDMASSETHYRLGLEKDPELYDSNLEERLGIDTDRENPDEDFEEAEEGGSEEEFDSFPAPEDMFLEEGPFRQGLGRDGDAEIENPSLTFADVGGMENLKEEIRMKIIHPLQHPEIFEAYGKKPGGGILMYGPPGCGKTFIARATAGEVKSSFIAIGLQDVLNMYVGESERSLHHLFELARNYAPCVLFFDEVDALAASRSDFRNAATRQVINQFLAELDGITGNNSGVLVLAATNAPWHLDPAFRRPGRFDRQVFVPPPDPGARGEILQIALAGKPADKIDYAKLAKKTEGFSGADLMSVVDIAIEAKLREAMAKGAPSAITTKSLLTSIKDVRPSTREWFNTARNYLLYANQSGIYDAIRDYLER